MKKFKIDKQNGTVFILRADAVSENGGYKLFYKKNRFWYSWQFIGIADSIKSIEQVIHYHFGFTSIIYPVS